MQERTILQFGKTADDVFTMDFGYPMTALQVGHVVCDSNHGSTYAMSGNADGDVSRDHSRHLAFACQASQANWPTNDV